MKRITVPEEGIETLFGSYDENLKHLESVFNVRIRTQGHDLLVEGGVTGYGWEQCWREYRRMSLYVFVYVVISLGTLDFANERGLALFNAWLRRSSSAIEDLRAAEEMPA